MKAVLIAGDHRTFAHSIGSVSPLLHDSDIFVSMWSESKYSHQCIPSKLYIKSGITEKSVREALSPHNVVDVVIEKNHPSKWIDLGYNSNFIHRVRCGIELIQKSKKIYDSVTVMRPDMFFGDILPLVTAVNDVQKNEFKTIWMHQARYVNKNLNDTLFCVRGEDLEKSFPTVEEYQPFKEQDWHEYLYNFVENAGFTVTNIEGVSCAILRPPTKANMTFADALKNTEAWDNIYISKMFREDGFAAAIKSWSRPNVVRALKDAGCDDATIINLLGPL